MMVGRSHVRWTILVSLVSLVVVPLLVSQSAEWVLHSNGCRFDLKAGTICAVAGGEWGHVLGLMFLWGRAIAFGFGIWVTLLCGGVAIAIHLYRRRAERIK